MKGEKMKFKLKKNQIKKIYNSRGNAGCFASNRITVDGMKVGYMYREDGSGIFPDSGWRFFAGDESEAYVNNPQNFHIFDLNTICNYDSEIIPYLESDIGTAYYREGARFIKESLEIM